MNNSILLRILTIMDKLNDIYLTLLRKNIINIYQVTNDLFIVAEDIECAYYILHTSDFETELRVNQVNDSKINNYISNILTNSNWSMDEIMTGKVVRIDLCNIFNNLSIY